MNPELARNMQQITLRLDDVTYKRLKQEATAKRVSLNAYIASILDKTEPQSLQQEQEKIYSLDDVFTDPYLCFFFARSLGFDQYTDFQTLTEDMKKNATAKFNSLTDYGKEAILRRTKEWFQKVYKDLTLKEIMDAYWNSNGSITELSENLGLSYHMVYYHIKPHLAKYADFLPRPPWCEDDEA
jgi:hypothetical protein